VISKSAPSADATLPLASAATSAATLDDFRALWPDIAKQLSKKNPAAGAQAQSYWEPESFDGRKLAIRCAKPGDFHAELMKESFPHLASVIHELTGLQVQPIVASDAMAPVRPVSIIRPVVSTPVIEPKPAEGVNRDDLFGNLMSRVDGIELDPKTLRARKSSSPNSQ
jgi:hypothetical protein